MKPNKHMKPKSKSYPPENAFGLRMVGVMLDNNYVDKLKHILLHHKRTCRGQIMAWIDEESRIIAKESQG